MKKSGAFLLAFALCLATLTAFCQVKSNFSDWNVPPPVPPGTLPKSPPPKVKIAQTPADVQAPSTGDVFNLKPAQLSAILQTAPEVEAPSQPEFPALPFATPEIPLPKAPDAVGLPQQTPTDEITETYTDMPEPPEPDLPVAPKTPEETQGQANIGDINIPLTPSIITRPVTVTLPAGAFPFIKWPLPAVPESINVPAAVTIEKNQDNKIINKKKTVKQRRGG